MKLIWFSHFIPYPPRGGSFQRTFNLLRHAARKYETTFVALNLQKEPPERLADYRKELGKFCARVEFWETPMEWKGVRWWANLALSPLRSLPHAARSLWSPALDIRWRALMAQHPEGLVLFETVDLAAYFPASQGRQRILNHQNCESDMARRRGKNDPNPVKKAYFLHQADKISCQERFWCPRFDANLAVSELDAARLRAMCGDLHVHVVENGTDTEYFKPMGVAAEPDALVFAGSLRWYPNVSGIRYFAERVWPRLRAQRPAIRLYLAGRSPDPSVVQIAARDPQVQLIPDPEDIRPWMARGSVFICPVLDGGGTRLKILDAMAMGLPIVTTTLGGEGLNVVAGKHLLVADTPEDFASATLSLLNQESLRRQLGAEGRKLVEEKYSWQAAGRHLEEACECTLRNGSSRSPSTCYRPAMPARTS
jgi:glycosyltransferase involved in cell wall biosynthesis